MFHCPGVPHSTDGPITWRQNCEIRRSRSTHISERTIHSDPEEHRDHCIPFSKESQDVINAVGNTELCELRRC